MKGDPRVNSIQLLDYSFSSRQEEDRAKEDKFTNLRVAFDCTSIQMYQISNR